MKNISLAIPLLVALVYAPAEVLAAPLLGAELASFSALAGSYASYGANSTIKGNVGSIDAITAGASGTSFNNYAGAAITLGANAKSTSSNAGAAITIGAEASGGVVSAYDASSVDIVRAALLQFASAKSALTKMGQDAAGNNIGTVLSPTMAGNVLITPGVYSATALTTAASTVLTFDGGGAANPIWVFNIDTYLVTGASTLVQFAPGTTNGSVLWNLGGYMTLGAQTSLIGTVLSTAYISEGAGAGISCGNAFSLGYVVLGDSFSSSASNCGGSLKGMGAGLDISENGTAVPAAFAVAVVPEPQTYAMLLAGLGLMAGVTRRRKNKPA